MTISVHGADHFGSLWYFGTGSVTLNNASGYLANELTD